MSNLEELKKEMRGLEERFLEKDGKNLSTILDPSKIPTDITDLAAIEQGRIATPETSPPEDEPIDEPLDEPSDDSEEDIKEMSVEEVKESLGLALDIAMECVEKADMILKALIGGDGKADLKDVVDKELMEKANDVAEEYIELVDYMEEVESDTGSEEDDVKDDEEGPEDKGDSKDKSGEEEPEKSSEEDPEKE